MEDTIPKKMYDTISYYMVKATKLHDVSGKQKKVFVLNKLKDVLSQEDYGIYFDLISEFIDFIIKISKNKKFLKEFSKKTDGIFDFCIH